ncbi:MAG: hypothetical protein CM1200mP12_05750 [Gammaproteobacteria bacterium]|nr:MAG: hypothetical protein CM1200mP12_05750 [Gammaproteobacteria bacterium]
MMFLFMQVTARVIQVVALTQNTRMRPYLPEISITLNLDLNQCYLMEKLD